MSNHIADANKMVSDTPRTDAAFYNPMSIMYDPVCEMKVLERELNLTKKKIKQLEEAGDRMTTWLRWNAREGSKELSALRQWRKAKEAKP